MRLRFLVIFVVFCTGFFFAGCDLNPLGNKNNNKYDPADKDQNTVRTYDFCLTVTGNYGYIRDNTANDGFGGDFERYNAGASGVWQYKHGDLVSFTVMLEPLMLPDGFRFGGWYYNNVFQHDNETFAMTMDPMDYAIEARFVPTSNHTFHLSTDSGEDTDVYTYIEGEAVKTGEMYATGALQIIAKINDTRTGTNFLGWYIGDECIVEGLNTIMTQPSAYVSVYYYTYVMPNADVSLVAKFAAFNYLTVEVEPDTEVGAYYGGIITVEWGEGNSAMPGLDYDIYRKGQVPHGQEVTITATVNEGEEAYFRFVGWYYDALGDNGTVRQPYPSVSSPATAAEYTFTVTQTLVLYARFARNEFSITTNVSNNTGGEVSGTYSIKTAPYVMTIAKATSITQARPAQTVITFTAHPEAGYRIVGWYVTSIDPLNQIGVGAFINVIYNESKVIILVFEQITNVTVSLSLENNNGTVKINNSSVTNVTVQKGAWVQFAATPSQGYMTSYYRGSNALANLLSTNNSYSFYANDTVTIVCVFREAGEVTVSLTSTGGTVKLGNDLIENPTFTLEKYKYATLVATPAYGYTFAGWYANSTSGQPLYQASTLYHYFDADITLIAHFVLKPTHTLTISVLGGTNGVVRLYNSYGDELEVTNGTVQIPHDEYILIDARIWTEDLEEADYRFKEFRWNDENGDIVEESIGYVGRVIVDGEVVEEGIMYVLGFFAVRVIENVTVVAIFEFLDA